MRTTEGRGGEGRVLIVDDHPMVRHGLSDLIASEPGLDVVGEAATAHEAMAVVDLRQAGRESA